MKRRAICFLILITLLVCLHIPASVFATSSYGFNLFTQDNYSSWKINSSITLKSDGCCLFAFVHALQFAKRTNYYDETLNALWQTYKKPSDTGSALAKYTTYAEKNLGISFKKNSKGSKELGTTSGQGLRDLFNSGYSLVVNNMTGHILCAVDYAICDSKGVIINDDGKTVPSGGAMYILIADSSPASSTYYSGRSYHNNVYSISDGKMVKRGNYSYGTENAGAAYWTKVNSLYVLRAIKGSWSGHSTVNPESGRWYKLTTKEVNVYQSIDVSSSVVRRIPANQGIIITGMYPGANNPTWYQVDGGFIRKEDLGAVGDSDKSAKADIGSIKHDNLSIKVQSKYSNHWLTAQPYANRDKMVEVNKGAQMTVVKVIHNTANHYWVQVEYNGGTYYTCANNVELVSMPGSDDPVTITSKVFPSGDLGDIKSFDIKGTVKCTYEISKATGGVYSSNYNYEKTIDVNKTSLDLYTSNINKSANGGIAFGSIPDGSYTFKLVIKYKRTTWQNQSRDDVDPIQSVEMTAPPKTSSFTIKRNNSIAVTGITLSPSTKTVWSGEVFSVTPTVTPDNATNKKLTWSSSDTKVATVVDGKVTAVGKGTAIITAEAKDNSGKKATCTITVKKPVTSVSISATSSTLYVNGTSTAKLTPTIQPSDASETGVTWSSSDTSKVTVDQNGNITAKAVGSVTITAKAIDGSGKQGTYQINVLAYVDTITLSGSGSVNVGATIKLASSVSPANATNKNLTWSSSDPSIATVDSNGNVKGLKVGSVTVTATANDRGTKKGSYSITVLQPVTEIEVNGSSGVLKGKTLSLTATVKPSDASNKTVSWSSENNNIATVNNGVVTAISPGNVVIWANATDGSGVKNPFNVRVQQPVTSIAISGEEVVPVAGSINLTANVAPSTADNRVLIWTSSQTTIASVNNRGVVTGLNPGTATITATATDGSGISNTFDVQVVQQIIAIKIEGESLVHTGNSVQLTAIVTSDEPLLDNSVTWSSSDTSIVTVNSNGVITGVANGSAIITATSNAESYYSAQHHVTVDTLVSKISITGTSTLDVGSKTRLSASVTPMSATNKNLIWSSSDESIAVVDGDGQVLATSAGTVTITATSTDGSGIKGTIKITVYPLPSEVTIIGESALLVNETTELSATVLPTNARNKSVAWSSSDTTIATVNSTGLVTAKGNGTAVITATAVGNTNVIARHEVVVTTLVSSVVLESPDVINVGDMGIVVPSIQPVTASNQQLIWASSDESLAVVDANGNVYGISPGIVTITAATTDESGVTAQKEILIYQPIQSISVDIDPIAYVGQQINLQAIILPEDATEPYVTWTSGNENIAIVQTSTETNGEYHLLECVDTGLVRITATATDGSNVSGYAYLQVLPYTELMSNTVSYTVYSSGNNNSRIGRVSMTTDCAVRIAEDKRGVVWSIEHISGDYAAAVSINENVASYNGFSLVNSVDLNLLRINRTGSDVYRVSCSANDQIAFCDVTIHVVQPANPLPESVSLLTDTFNSQVGETISIDTTSHAILPSAAILPEETEVSLYGQGAFNRYAQVTKNNNVFTVTFSKAGIYSAFVRYSGANYQYDANVEFVITTASGTVPPEVEEITINDPVKYLLVGETSKFDVNIIPSASDEADLLWSSSNPDVVSVGADGTLTAMETGTSIITVSADNGISATGFVAVTETLLSIDWDDDEIIEVYVGGNSKTVVQRIYLTPRASAQLTEAPTWSLKRIEGNNLTLLCKSITGKDSSCQDLYGCAIILKSVSAFGMTEYELTCSDGLYSASSTIKVNANEVESLLPSMISWSNTSFSGRINELISIRPAIQCWPEGTILPDSVIVSVDGDQYWNAALNKLDYSVSRNAMTFSFSEPGVYTANCIYSCSNMRYLVPITVRISDENGVVPVRAAALTLSENEISINAGNTAQLKAMIAPEDATNKTVTWSVEDPSVATVNTNGLVTGVANGRTNVWCTPEDTNCAAVKCVVVVEDDFTITQTEEMSTQYLQGETGNSIASFRLSEGTARRMQDAGLEPVWSFNRVSGNAAEVDLIENNGNEYLVVSALKRGGTDTYEVTCSAGAYTWTGHAALTVSDLGSSVPTSVSISQVHYSASVGEEIELDFTPVCSPNSTSIPTGMRTSYIGVGQFYNGLVASYKTQILTSKKDKVKVAFRKKGTYLLSRYYRDRNLTFITECTINVGDGSMNLLKCNDLEATVYIGGKPGIAATCVISDTSIEELYGDELVWTAEKLSGDCLHVALRVDQSSAALYVADTTGIGEEVWRVSCSFRGITDYIDITIQAVEPAVDLPETVSLRQSEYNGMIGNVVTVPLAVQCEPEGTNLPSIEDEAWSFVADGNTEYNASWSITNSTMSIRFRESGYYGGRLIYDAGNVSYNFPISFAITDEESVLPSPEQMDVSLSTEIMTVYPEGEINVPIVNAVLSDSLDMYSMASIAAYAQSKDATWSLEILSGNSCDLSIKKVSASSVQIVVDEIVSTGNVNYRITCAVDDHQYSADGTIHVASNTETRPQAELKQTYFLTSVGTRITIDASFYNKTSNLKLCAGKDSIWDNADAMAAMGYDYQVSGDLLMPVFNTIGTYTTTISNRVSNLLYSQEIKIVVFNAKPLPENPSTLMMPKSLQVIDEEAFAGVKANIIDLRGTKTSTIKSLAFANNTDLLRIYIPSSVTSISRDAFSECSDFEIYCVQGSYADTWAQGIGYPVNYDMD